ncbi:MAG: shikimate kinase [Desulfoprunum sp.]|nr:shikimate kinase [Desulfoprunum sp.]
MKNNIVLIGFMGVGKGRTARSIAAKTNMYAVDCDDLIESLANMKIKTIFEVHGEEYFRRLEQKTAKWLEESVSSTIISSGGGFFKVKNLKKIGKIIYLHADFETILAGLMTDVNAEKKLRKRPLLQDLDKARSLFAERVPLYRQAADVEIPVAGLSADQVAQEIISALEGEKKKKNSRKTKK